MLRRIVQLACVFAALVGVATVAAAAQDAVVIQGTLEKIEGEDREPVEGVRIVARQGGADIGEAVSASDGTWRIEVPGPGTYEVELDVDTLPDGIDLTHPERSVLPEVVVRSGRDRTVLFPLGPGIVSEFSAIDRFADLFIIGLKLGAIIAVASIGLSLIFGVTGLVNFAHGELVTLGAVVAFFFNGSVLGPQWQIIVAADTSASACGGIRVVPRGCLVATAAPQGDRPDRDARHLNRPFVLAAPRNPHRLRRPPAELHQLRRAAGVELPRLRLRPEESRHHCSGHCCPNRRWAVPPEDEDGHCDAGRCGQCRPRRVVGHRRRTGHYGDLDRGRAAGRVRWRAVRISEAVQFNMGFRCCCLSSPQSCSAGWARLTERCWEGS